MKPFWIRAPKNLLDELRAAENVVTRPISKRNFLGSVVSRLTGDWDSTLYSPNEEVKANAAKLRGRARDLTKNNSYASNYLELLAINVVGPEGIRINPRILKKSDELDTDVNAQIRTQWARWSEKVSIDGQMGLAELAKLALKTCAGDGEVFVIMHKSVKNMSLQLIDADYLDYEMKGTTKAGGVIKQGIEFDRNGMVAAYHFFKRHPAEKDTFKRGENIMRVKAEDVIHIYRPLRTGQVRGLTWFHKVMYNLHMLGEAKRFELIAARVSAGKMGFITKTQSAAPDDLDDLNVDGDYDHPPKRTIEVGPGQLVELEFGEDFKAWNPDHPNAAFKEFTALELKGIASGLGISYSSLSSDLSEQSYSGGRLGSIRERDTWKELQAWFSKMFYARVYNEWIKIAILNGTVEVARKDVTLYTGADKIRWQARGFSHVDPLKDLKAYSTAIGLGLMDRTTVVTELGFDINEIFLNLAAEKNAAAELDIDITSTLNPGTPEADVDSAATNNNALEKE